MTRRRGPARHVVAIMVSAWGVSRKTARLDVWTLAPYFQPFAGGFSLVDTKVLAWRPKPGPSLHHR